MVKPGKKQFFELIIKPDLFDPLSNSVKNDIVKDLKVNGLKKVKLADAFYFIKSRLSSSKIKELAEAVFLDSVMQDCQLNKHSFNDFSWLVKVYYHDNVTDNVALVALEALKDAGVELNRHQVKSARHYYFYGRLKKKDIEFITQNFLANDLMESFEIIKGRN